MILTLPENISKLRKAHAMTQEQLAEALGVTFASVSKWERGVATPDLHLIAEMADLFGVSLDVLVGFEVLGGGAAALEKRIHDLQRQKRYDEAVIEAEKALLRYPHDFRIVHRAGELYTVAGIESENEKYLHRCIALLERAIGLLSQNTDPKISEVSIQNEIAQCYLVLGQHEKGLDILKKYNVGGIHDDLIAMTYACNTGFDPKEAEPYMMAAFGHIVASSVRTMMAYANYYVKLGDYAASREAIAWLIGMLEGVKTDPQAVAYVDKVIAPCYSECANLSLLLGETDKVEPYMGLAYETAMRFDAAPTCQVSNTKFAIGDIQQAIAYDDLGETAAAAVLRQITQEDRDERLLRLWEQMTKEETRGGKA